MDNRIISVQSEGRGAFYLAFQLVFDNAPGGKASHYIEHPEFGLIFLWSKDKFLIDNVEVAAIKLPYPMGWKAAGDLAWGWLKDQPDNKYKEYLDHDGDNEHGFRVYNEDWGHVAESHYAICAVLPVWAWYGK